MADQFKVSIIVPTYLEQNKPYLDLCIKSIANLNYDQSLIETIIVGRETWQPQYPNTKTILRHDNEGHFAQAINCGLKEASLDSKYLFLVSDDVILTRNSLIALTNIAADKKLLLNPISPCDNGLNYELLFGIPKGEGEFQLMMHLAYDYDEIKEHTDALMNADSIYPLGLTSVNYLCMFATLIPRSVFEEIGPLDENFKTGQEDLDYCVRAHHKHIRTMCALNALVWHFSGRTANVTMTAQLRKYNIEYFKQKHGYWPPGLTDKQLLEIGIIR